jgi:hypothetical protein
MNGKRLALTAVLVAGLIVAATGGLSSSTGQTPEAPGLTYGGQKDDYSAWLRLVPGREAIASMQMDWAIAPERCSNRRVHTSILYAGSEELEFIRVSQAGKFNKTVVDRYKEEGSRIEEHQTVQGSITGDVATGSISGRVRIVKPNGQVVRCNFGPQRWRMVD